MESDTTTTKTLRANDMPRLCEVELPDDRNAVVAVSISPAEKPSRRPLVDFIGAGKGVYRTRGEVDAVIRKLRDEWQN